MAGRIRNSFRRVGQSLARSPVEETGRFARALTALVGGTPALEVLPGGARQLTRATYTARSIAALGPVPWPCAIMRQLDPDDPAFLPALGLHPVLSARDRSFLGLPGWNRMAWVDPTGWCGIGEGPAIAVWFGDENGTWPVGRRPDEFGSDDGHATQVRSDEGVGIITTSRRAGLELRLLHWPVVLEGQLCWALHASVQVLEGKNRYVRLALAVRPQGAEGATPCFDLERDRVGIWRANGRPILALDQPGNEVITAVHGEPDPWLGFQGSTQKSSCELPGPVRLHCAAGLASIAEISGEVLGSGQTLTRMAVVGPSGGVGPSLVRTSGKRLWHGASADRRGLLSAGSEIVLEDEPGLFDAARIRLLMEPSEDGLAASVGAVCLARMGFTRRAGERLSRWMDRIRRNGELASGSPDDGALLAWAASEYVRWTGELGWLQEVRGPWTRLLDCLADRDPLPGGISIFGLGGSPVWSRIWKTAALLGGSAALRNIEPQHERWAIAGGMAREKLISTLGSDAWTASSTRAPDGSSAALLVAPWIGLVPVEHPGVSSTISHIRQHYWHGGGVLLHGGAHTAATAIFEGVRSLIDPSVDAVATLARLASGTSSLPTARHPQRGAIGEGDDPLSAALFVLTALDRIRIRPGRITILPGIQRAQSLPTPIGRIDVEVGKETGRTRVYGRWRGAAPDIRVL